MLNSSDVRRGRVLTDGDGVDHHGDLGDTPTHDDRTDAQVVLERRTESDKSADVERHRDVACPMK